ncbi:MAG: ABC transporter permease [Gammaproteobacteria bacterium]|nr:ABC transporter permease [Gammaproteobacteria bacterium]
MIRALAQRELTRALGAPGNWVLLALLQFVLAYLFLLQLEWYQTVAPKLANQVGAPGVTDLIAAPLFSSAAALLLTAIPLLTMPLISEEYRTGTIRLLLSAPISSSEIILGKYLGCLLFLTAPVTLAIAPTASLAIGTQLDWGQWLTGVIGLLLLCASVSAIGLFFSTVTRTPLLAAMSTFATILLLWVIQPADGSATAGGILSYLALPGHLTPFTQGLLNSGDLLYHLLLTCTALALAVLRLDLERRPL